MATITITGVEGRKFDVPTGLFINNEFVPAKSGATVSLENPASGAKLGDIASAEAADVDEAVKAAETAYKTVWSQTLPEQRRNLLNKLADLMERDAAELASIEAVDAGILYRDSFGMAVPQAVETCRYYAGWADKLDGDSLSLAMGMAYTRREPFGVCAAIVPWNAPLMITSWKLAPALAAGNCLIIKTPEIAPLYGQKLAMLVKEAGFPPGVVSILCGLGSVAGQRLAEHPDIHKLSFTGSAAVGRAILAASARTNLKKVTLELGGKGPSIVFDDADWNNALFWTTAGITMNNGQICAAGSRIYVQESIYQKFIEQFSAMSRDAVAGDPLLSTTTKGPLVSQRQKDTVMNLIKAGREQGTKILHGGDDSELDPKGHFVPNTAFVDVGADSTIMRQEVFGPVASIASFKTEEEVVALANDSHYGLAAAVFSNDINKAIRVSNALEVGQVTVNMWGVVTANTAFGGYKESGMGRDLGKEALDGWTQVKSVKVHLLKANI
ncbi:uncharacterized protein E0L32_011831 [Thyridium curvatum]|uniref:aldehyde dehydrogenase (NAD(+)) n=1 Tax=Thyridium curvatum TaxID=1093900 RepID=A0A507BDT1_9PEZI|nr:uncharacterized protein E0L32_011831 [Thyridium curvatum]TPX18107.1 hypothetical protein E0L32_011831 [Thyridium curvatum]